MDKKKTKWWAWWFFLQILPDGWSSEDPAVDKMLKHLVRKGRRPSSRSFYMRILHRFCVHMSGIKPAELVELDRLRLGKKVQEFCDLHVESKNYANALRNALNSFFHVNDVTLNTESYKVPKRWRKRPEYIPTLREALKMAEVTRNLRDRCIILFLIYCGLRNATLRALRISETYPDTPVFNEYTIRKELERNLDCLIVIIHPAMRQLVPDACKNDITYFCFVPRRAVESLKDYLRERKLKWGKIGDREPLFILERVRKGKKEPQQLVLTSTVINVMIKNAARLAGLELWEYVSATSLRKVFNNFLINQEGRQLKPEENEFFMGHLLPGVRDTYFDKTKIEEMRKKYSRLDFDPMPQKEKKVNRIVPEDELDSYLKLGSEIVAVLPSGKIVIACDESKLRRHDPADTDENNDCDGGSSQEKDEGNSSEKSRDTNAKRKKTGNVKNATLDSFC